MRQFRKHRPDLIERVEAGEIPSLYPAMVEAGLRDKTLTVPLGIRKESPRSCGEASATTICEVWSRCWRTTIITDSVVARSDGSHRESIIEVEAGPAGV